MFEYKTIPLDKTRVLMMNGIYVIKNEDNNNDFIQYNDYFSQKTFFQCPKCKSLNVEIDNLRMAEETLATTKQCSDCGYLNRLWFEENDND
ncbi:hypothetical protein M3C31_01925 [Staphylococcus hominis]|uniref:hypothetical protein n=1 Tax=Staphylococcus hominis TaxID=1290 RepID=UPI0021A5ECBC|nr:hypothetical protein [Staphylococcus hominis]MCT1482607.1 hypothetical protein [Staphylococcus hominis]